MSRFPFYRQYDSMDCGPTCLKMIAKFYGKYYSIESLREKAYLSREGVSLYGISEAAQSIGFNTMGVKVNFNQLAKDVTLPCIAHWRQNHFIVIYKIKKDRVYIADPAVGKYVLGKEEFIKGWGSDIIDNEKYGVCLILEPTQNFYMLDSESAEKEQNIFSIFSYLKFFRNYLFQLIIAFILTLFLQILFPLIFQSLIDKGILLNDKSFITIVFIAWIIIVITRLAIDFLRNWILLYFGARINVVLITNFLNKLLKLKMKFFDIKLIGDILQRIYDNQRIELFLTNSILSFFYSLLSTAILGIVLLIFSYKIFLIFIIGTILYIFWISVFMNKRYVLDNERFIKQSLNYNKLIHITQGIHEIKLNQCEHKKIWEWQGIQASIFKINLKSLLLFQYQQIGAALINELKNILILLFAANATMKGEITLGTMIAIAFVIGQLSFPVDVLIRFFHSYQDANLSYNRQQDINNYPEENFEGSNIINEIPIQKSITISNLTFSYSDDITDAVLQDINLSIPEKKITAIVGPSGSGKTTLLKLLLAFYEPQKGIIKIGDINLNNISKNCWRKHIGVVMQDGYLFSDTIAKNIAPADDSIDKQKLVYAAKMANILDFIYSLPLGFNTKIGDEGIKLSQGQKQRILIARVIYKNPDFVFFDEATNALDASNEKVIINNLKDFFVNKTVIIIAHRLSTVKYSDKIVVLEKGRIVEEGNHENLIKEKGFYYNLIKDQLELGEN